MSTGLMMVIAAVFIITICFGMIIIRQFGAFEKKAMVAKLRQEEYIQEYMAKVEEEKRIAEEEAQNNDENNDEESNND